MGLQRRIRGHLLGLFPQATQTLGNHTLAWGVIRFPHPVLHLGKDLTQGCGRPITDFQKRMETTSDDCDVGQQGLPGTLGGWPAVRIDRVRRVILIHGARFPGEDTVRLLYVRLRC
jgi:hypothetical protein